MKKTYILSLVLVSTLFVGAAYAVANSGEEAWSTHTQARTRPAASGNMLVAAGNQAVFGYDRSSGDRIWRVSTSNASLMSPPALHDSNVIFSKGAYIQAHNIQSGEEVWQVNLGHGNRVTPIVHEDHVYVGAQNYVYKLNASNGEEVWEQNVGGRDMSGITVYQDEIYFLADNRMYALKK